ncbi:hypothetical protein Q1695_004335 [Nippostrongylus brasiliensis]|nr:hypothetical protein Q1695_004335 [Nippostrongylus brasiliensis]
MRLFSIVEGVRPISDVVPKQREQQKKFKELVQNAAQRDTKALQLLKNATNAGYIRTLLKKAKSQLIEIQRMKSTETKIATLREALSRILSALKRFFAVELCAGAEGNECITAREEIAQAALNVEVALKIICGSKQIRDQIDEVFNKHLNPPTSNLQSKVWNIGDEILVFTRQC